MEDRFSFQAPRGRKVNHKYLDREPVLDHPVLGRLADNCAVESVRKHSLTSFVKLPVAKPLLSGIEIHGWTITSIKAPISSQAEFQTVEKVSGLANLPEMLFGRNELSLRHEGGFTLSINALDALKTVKKGSELEEQFKVKAAHVWQAKPHQTASGLVTAVQDHDWTFSPHYAGTLAPGWQPFLADDCCISKSKLQVPETILFHDKVQLYQDELADNGEASLTAQVRVMESGFFLLLRFFMRVDGVVLRMRDVRFYHSFGTDFLLRETCNRDMPIENLKPLFLSGNGVNESQLLLSQQWVSDHMVPPDPFFQSTETPPYINSSGEYLWHSKGGFKSDPEFLELVQNWKSERVAFVMRREQLIL